MARADLLERSIKQHLERLPGVARVEVEGVARQEVLVALDKDRISAHGVALNELVGKLQAAGVLPGVRRADHRSRAPPARAAARRVARTAGVARPADRWPRHAPVRYRRCQPAAAAHELRAQDGRQAQRGRG
ncbi:hypothetical protein, partial [Pseudoxanthomonas mexicana]